MFGINLDPKSAPRRRSAQVYYSWQAFDELAATLLISEVICTYTQMFSFSLLVWLIASACQSHGPLLFLDLTIKGMLASSIYLSEQMIV